MRDQEIPVKRNFVKVVVQVEDCNDHSPAFLSPRYEASVSNQAPTGSEVIRVKALDKDMGSNADISYSLHSGEQQRDNFYLLWAPFLHHPDLHSVSGDLYPLEAATMFLMFTYSSFPIQPQPAVADSLAPLRQGLRAQCWYLRDESVTVSVYFTRIVLKLCATARILLQYCKSYSGDIAYHIWSKQWNLFAAKNILFFFYTEKESTSRIR